jgi:hypothetical protein
VLVATYAGLMPGRHYGTLAYAERDAYGDEDRVKAIIGARLRLDLAQLFGRQVTKEETCGSLDELPPNVSTGGNPEDRWTARIDTEGYVRRAYPYLYLHVVKEMTSHEIAEETGDGHATVDRRIAEEKQRAADDPYFTEQGLAR